MERNRLGHASHANGKGDAGARSDGLLPSMLAPGRAPTMPVVVAAVAAVATAPNGPIMPACTVIGGGPVADTGRMVAAMAGPTSWSAEAAGMIAALSILGATAPVARAGAGAGAGAGVGVGAGPGPGMGTGPGPGTGPGWWSAMAASGRDAALIAPRHGLLCGSRRSLLGGPLPVPPLQLSGSTDCASKLTGWAGRDCFVWHPCRFDEQKMASNQQLFATANCRIGEQHHR